MADQKRSFLFLYLNTGSGHKSAATVLRNALLERDKNVSVTLLNGFDKKFHFGEVIFEQFYRISCSYVPSAFSLVYDLGQHRWFQNLIAMLVRPHVSKYLEKQIVERNITDVISFHFGLTPSAVSAVRRIYLKTGKKIRLSCMVTDPFTIPKTWYYEKNIPLMVFSEAAKRFGVEECGVPEKNISVVPFLMKNTFRVPATAEQIYNLRIKHGFDPYKKLLLLAGGGEGLKGARSIVMQCIAHKADFQIAVVCGRDMTRKHSLDLLYKLYSHIDLHVYGFVDFMDELVKICDCAVIKAGPATLMEVLACKKPVILSTYIHNQELGNVRYAVRHKVGWFIQSPRKIYQKVATLFSDEALYAKVKQHAENLHIDTDVSKIVDTLLTPPEA